MASRVTIGLVDGMNESFSFGVTVNTIVGAGWPTLETAVSELEGFLEDVSYGAKKTRTISDTDKYMPVLPTADGAHRESAVKFYMQTDDGFKSSVSVGAPILSVFPFAALNKDYVSVPYASVSTEVAALINWLEITARHPILLTSMTVYAIEFIGRNL